MYTTGKLYETRKSGKVPIGVEIPVRIIGAVVSIKIYGSEQPPAALANMVDIDPASSPYIVAGYQRFNSLPRFISFVGTADDIEVSNVALDDKGAIS